MIGWVLGVVAWVWLRTLRVTLEVDPSLPCDRPWVLCFFHGKQWPLLAWRRRRRTAVMVSLSRDGALQARVLTVLGFDVVRGSSSRGGARGLAAVVRRLRRGDADAAFAVDGPRGPYGVVKEGALVAARRSGAVLVPMGSAISGGGKVFARAWDRYAVAWPFARVAVVLGAALPAEADACAAARAIEAANARAEALLPQRRTYMVPSRP
ncbi:MAG: DUF374 domain-containing protein [Labilithrix sp.]|nr:DUF374 domain-containing protein [Labilithrix sp.]MCW5816863.1 DUF374 domain-containing protein [Labilithrix sp.]